MWTPNAREQHSRKALRYQSDLTDAEWAVIVPHLPPVRPECFFAWINRNRRLAKDIEATVNSVRAFLYAASVMLLVRRLVHLS